MKNILILSLFFLSCINTDREFMGHIVVQKPVTQEPDTFKIITPEFWGYSNGWPKQENNSTPQAKKAALPPPEFSAFSPMDTIRFSGNFLQVLAGETFDNLSAVYISETDGKAYKAGLTPQTAAQGIAIDTALSVNDTLHIITRGIIYGYDDTSAYNKAAYSVGGGAISYSGASNPQKVGELQGNDLHVKIEPILSQIEIIKRKKTDETRTGTTTLTNDSQLQIPLLASSLYWIELWALVKTDNANMDYKYGISYSGTTSSLFYDRSHTVAGAALGAATLINSAGTNTFSSSVAGTTFGIALVKVNTIVSTSTSGTFSFQWSQNTTDAGNISVLAGSYIKYTKL